VPGSILVVDDDPLFSQNVQDLLARHGHRVARVEKISAALERLAAERFELVLADVALEGAEGLEWVASLREPDPAQEIILLGDRADVNGSVTALRAGVAECLIKPIEDADLLLAVERSLERAGLRQERSRLLDETAELSRFQSLHQRCLEVVAQPELEWLQERVLAELASLADAQSAALWLSDDRGQLLLRAYRGLLDKQFLAESIPRDAAITAQLVEGVPWTSGDAGARILRVPRRASGEVVGFAQLSDPLGGDFRPEQVRILETLADFAAVGLRNAKRFLSLQRLGLRDRDTAAYNLSYFTDYASKEIYKARRYARTFSLLTFSIDNLAQVRLRIGAEEARRATRAIIRALSRIVRDSDVIAKASDQEFYLLLPETDYFGAMMFTRRAIAAVREEPEVQAVEAQLPLALAHGASTFPKDGEAFDELVHRCRNRMEQRRGSLQRKLQLDPLSFWEEVEILLGSAQSPRLPVDPKAEPSRRGKVADPLFEELQAEIARELCRDPLARGMLYLGVPDVRADLHISLGLEQAPSDLSSRVYLLGRRADLESHPSLTPVFLEGDERMGRHEFLLWLSESSAYALLQRRGVGATWGFHSSDVAVVDALISKLQSEYDLQPY
jgi:diguanylate cyclase (GGDEF)-like protein